MEVELINFRQYHDITFNFEPNQLTLIAGRSGIGKSTIFEAIRWCITGKLQRISPHDLPKGKTSVRVTFPDGTIYYRLNSPKRFEVTKSNIPSSNGTEKVDEIELNEMYWNATTYLKQLDFHPLLEASESDKLDLITTLALRKNDPSSKINEIKTLIGIYSTKISKQQAVICNSKRQLNKELTANKLTIEDLEYRPMITIEGVEVDDPLIVMKKIEEFEERKTKLHQQLVEYQVNEKRKKELVKGITKTKEQIQTEIDMLTQELELHTAQRDQLALRKEKDGLETKLKIAQRGYIEPDEPLPKGQGWNDIEISKATEQANQYNLNLGLAKKNKIAYDKAIIQDRITQLKVEIEELTEQDNLLRQAILMKDQYDEYQRIKQDLSFQQNLLSGATDKLTLLVEVPSPEDDIKIIEEQISSIDSHRADEYYEAEKELQQSVLTCPHCSGPVKYQRNSLIKINHYDPKAARSLISEINQERSAKKAEYDQRHQELLMSRKEFNSYKMLKKKYDQEIYRLGVTIASLEKNLGMFKSIPELSAVPMQPVQSGNDNYQAKIKKLMGEVSSLSIIKFYAPPEISPERMMKDNNLIKSYQRKEEIDQLKQQIDDIVIPYEIVNLQYTTIKETKTVIASSSDQLYRLNEADNIVLGPNPVKSYDQTSKAITQLRTTLDEMNTINRLIEHQDEITLLDQELSDLSDTMETAANLMSKMEEAKYASLIVIVNRLNKKINKYLRMLFLDPIIFRLDMFRENKTGKKDIKPKVNVNINYKGHDVDLKSLSGGEYARVSLSILLALAKVNNSPLIMMDESLGSLEQDDLQRTVNFIKHYNRKHTRTILYIGHGETTGWYDRLITL